MSDAGTVAQVMITAPTVHPGDLTVGGARASLARPKQHVVLLVAQGRLLGTLLADDLPSEAPDDEPALPYARLEGRTARPGDTVEDLWARLDEAGARRLAVTDDNGNLLGLVCLKRSGTGFCTVEGIAAWRAEQSALGGSDGGDAIDGGGSEHVLGAPEV